MKNSYFLMIWITYKCDVGVKTIFIILIIIKYISYIIRCIIKWKYIYDIKRIKWLMNIKFCHTWVLLYLFHSWYTAVCQTKNPDIWEHNFKNNITPLIIFIISDVYYNLGKFRIESHTADEIVAIITFLFLKYLYIPMKFTAILVFFALNRPIFLLWTFYDFDLNI